MTRITNAEEQTEMCDLGDSSRKKFQENPARKLETNIRNL